MNKFVTNILCLAVILHATGKAQESDKQQMQASPFQMTFIPPLSTNGIKNSRMINKVSINLLIGNSGGIDGFEAGTLINSVNQDVSGFQLSGFGNIVGGSSQGCQLSGFMNINGSSTSVFQGTGFINITGSDMKGAQIAGFSNLTGGTTCGFQGAGLFNITQSVTGAQAAGFCNIAGETGRGAQISGFINIARTGFTNAQLAGFINIGPAIDGIQVSGFLNKAGHVKGVQAAGFLNICDSLEGVPVGFINVVKKNGYRRIEFSVSEVKYANISYKMGVRRLYNIYSFGKPHGPGSRWMYGFGLGSEMDLTDNLILNLEAETNQELWLADAGTGTLINSDRLNMINQVRANFGWKIQERVVLFIGPSFNVSVSDSRTDEGLRSWYPVAPSWTIYNHFSANPQHTNVCMWFGINGGIRF